MSAVHLRRLSSRAHSDWRSCTLRGLYIGSSLGRRDQAGILRRVEEAIVIFLFVAQAAAQKVAQLRDNRLLAFAVALRQDGASVG